MNNLICYELVDETVNSVVFSRNVKFSLCTFIRSIEPDNLEKAEWPFLITAAVETPNMSRYSELMKSNSEICTEISIILPSVSRIFKSIQAMFTTQMEIVRRCSRNEELYADITRNILENGTDTIDSIQSYLGISLIKFISKYLQKEQDNIIDALRIIDIVNDVFLFMKDTKLMNHINNEKEIQFKQINETDSIFDDLQEAEKGLERVMDPHQLMLFRELCVSIKIRNKKNNE